MCACVRVFVLVMVTVIVCVCVCVCALSDETTNHMSSQTVTFLARSNYLSFYLPIYFSIYLSIYLSVPKFHSICVCITLSICSSIHVTSSIQSTFFYKFPIELYISLSVCWFCILSTMLFLCRIETLFFTHFLSVLVSFLSIVFTRVSACTAWQMIFYPLNSIYFCWFFITIPVYF